MNPWLKAQLSKLNFEINRNPRVEKSSEFRKFVPEPYQAVLTISADFELAWAWRFGKPFANPLESAHLLARRERENMPAILALCNQYQIPVTWATVGHLFLERCCAGNGKAHNHLPRPAFFENAYWQYSQGDWYDCDPCSDYKTSPEWYCPDLIEQILHSGVDHEIGSHTFSHIDCREEICTTELFRAELQECRRVAEPFGIDLKTFIYPAHTVGHLNQLRNLGFTCYRSNLIDTLGYPVKHPDGLWEIKTTMQLENRQGWSYNYQIYRTRRVIDRSIKNHSVCHFWFHPSFSKKYLQEVIPGVFDYLALMRERIWITTMGNYVDWLNQQDVVLQTDEPCNHELRQE